MKPTDNHPQGCWCTIDETGFSVSVREYLIAIARAEVRGDAPVGMTASLVYALASTEDRMEAESNA